jgi:mannosyl-3-phosphoglycerate phosphatase family protein
MTPTYTAAAAALKPLRRLDAALVLCSAKTRAEMEFVQQKLDLEHPFMCENGGAVIIPNDYFPFDPPDSRSLPGRQAIEFGRPYDDVVEALHRAAGRLGVNIIGFSDMSIEEVAQACQLTLLQARLAKLREYEEPFRILGAAPAARARLFKALDGAGLRVREGATFCRVGAPVDTADGVSLLIELYRRRRVDLTTVGVVQTKPDGSLLKLVDHSILVADDEPEQASIDIVDWAEAIVESIKDLRDKRAASWPASVPHPSQRQ